MAEGAIHLDTTPYTLDEVVQQVVDIVDEAVGAKADSGLGLGPVWVRGMSRP